MNANPILLQKKYVRIVDKFAQKSNLTLDAALDFFYQSILYTLMHEGVSDMHCMSDDYLADELIDEYRNRRRS